MSENNNSTLEKMNHNQENRIKEPEVIYEIQPINDFVCPQEWIDEADEAGRRMDSGEDKGYTHEEIMKMAYAHLAAIQNKKS